MMKQLKKLTALLFLFAMLLSVYPVESTFSSNEKDELSLCTDDDVSKDYIKAE